MGRFLLFAALAATLLGPASATAQTTRTIKIVVPFQPGGGTDILARVVAEQIGRMRPVTIIVENRPGAGTAIGAEAVARSPPDGNTLLLTSSGFVITPHFRRVGYDPVLSFEPICHLASSPLILVVNSASPYRTLADLMNAARNKPGGLTLAASGPGGGPHVTAEMLKRAANVSMTYVPYPGGAPAVNALLGEHVTSVLTDYPTAMAQIKAGKLRALATTLRDRDEVLPDVPTVAESGYRDYEADVWLGVLAPAKVPQALLSGLANLFIAAMQVPEVKTKLVPLGLFPAGKCGADFGAFIRKQYDDYGRVIREANIKGE
jgi:tripartite-type tricarboxylate transporter receptor subunit TctC